MCNCNSSPKSKIMFTEMSGSSLDVRIPSYPGSQRSFAISEDSETSGQSYQNRSRELQEALDYLHSDSPLMEAAEVGNTKRIVQLLQLRLIIIFSPDAFYMIYFTSLAIGTYIDMCWAYVANTLANFFFINHEGKHLGLWGIFSLPCSRTLT